MNSREKEVIQAGLSDEKFTIKELERIYEQAKKDCEQKIADLNARTDLQNIQSIVYQRQYQEALKKQLDGVLDNLHGSSFKTVSDYLGKCYENGFYGTLYDLQGQGVPFLFSIRQDQVVKALEIDSKLSKKLYTRMGEDVGELKKSIRYELSRGVANGSSYLEMATRIANGMNSPFNKAINRTFLITRTEGHRVQEQAAMDVRFRARDAGADILKQWDATLDDKTREWHADADGQIRELDDFFIVDGEQMEAPGIGGSAHNVCNCRCFCSQRARWALGADETRYLADTSDMTDEQLERIAKKLGVSPEELRKDAGLPYDQQKWNNHIVKVNSKDYDDFKRQAKSYSPEDLAKRKLEDKLSKQPPVKVGGVEVKQYQRQHGFGNGTSGGVKKTGNATVYRTKEGVEFVFPDKMNKSRQTMTPEQALRVWDKVPTEIKDKAPRTIEFVDYYNPQDTCWRKAYKNFTHSYATGGDTITFYRFDRQHDDDYLLRTYCHESGHFIDKSIKTSSGVRFADDTEWTTAMKNDIVTSGKRSPTKYGENANVEDFAESMAEYVGDPKGFEKQFPERTAIIKCILGIP